MNAKAPLYQGDVKPLEFAIAVTVGGIGSAVLSGLRVHPLVSVGFALVVMGVLAVLRWRIASEFKDFESLEAFAEDIYLLGYLLTLAALLGLAPRLMSDDTNLFNIAGLKLVTTVVGLGLMMIFRQTARRWEREEERGESEKFREQQRVFSEAVGRLNEGADALTEKLDEVVRRFDPGLLVPVAEWSNRAAGAFSAAAKTLDVVPAALEKSLRCLSDLNCDLEKVRSASVGLAGVLAGEAGQAAGALAGELGQAGKAASEVRGALAALQPASEEARGALQKLGTQTSLGVTQFGEIRTALERAGVELSKVEGVLREITAVNATDVKAPINRLVQALDISAGKTTDSAERMEALGARLQSVTAASEDLSKRVTMEVSKPLAEHQAGLERVQQQVARAAEQLEGVAKKLETMVSSKQLGDEFATQLLARLGELQAAMKETNGQIGKVANRLDEAPGPGGRSGFFSLFRGGR